MNRELSRFSVLYSICPSVSVYPTRSLSHCLSVFLSPFHSVSMFLFFFTLWRHFYLFTPTSDWSANWVICLCSRATIRVFSSNKLAFGLYLIRCRLTCHLLRGCSKNISGLFRLYLIPALRVCISVAQTWGQAFKLTFSVLEYTGIKCQWPT